MSSHRAPSESNPSRSNTTIEVNVSEAACENCECEPELPTQVTETPVVHSVLSEIAADIRHTRAEELLEQTRALTNALPASSSRSSLTDVRRQPENLQDLLRFSIQAMNTDLSNAPTASTGTGDSTCPERRQWLQEVLKHMSVDVVKVLLECMESLQTSNCQTHISPEEIEISIGALETIGDHIGSLDMANNFEKIGGFKVLKECLRSISGDIRAATANVFAELCQNNPHCQEHALKVGIFPIILSMLDEDPHEEAKVKAMYAISCACRNYPEALKAIEDLDGFSVLLRAMQSNVPKIQIKASFFVSCLCSDPHAKKTLTAMGFVDQLTALFQQEHHRHHEYIAAALLALVENNKEALKDCVRPELNLFHTLNERIANLQNKEEYEEELQHCKDLLNVCFHYDALDADR